MKILAIISMILGVGIWTHIGINTFIQKNQQSEELLLTQQSTDALPDTSSQDSQATPLPTEQNPPPDPTPTATPRPTNEGLPTRLIIPKIGVNIGIEYVGLDAAGRMDVPKDWRKAAWYNLGYRVGYSGGTAVMSGHLDTSSGAPAAFWNIERLAPGDEITVTDAIGETYKYKVVEKIVYARDEFPLQKIFGTEGVNGLNLITCEGLWDRIARNYTHRTVIYSVMI